ncbi:hypothetical protein E4Q08_22825 [Candidatus Accumulibacter phosphatis]|uniref:ABC transmembrane type-1 domain-containing protein n=1 Tax=Candidatus Accumulibacter contiguus TaxID=2954381 RepID=A0ABX1TDU0_9PROT|nr:hypothetical protein [Candidatus Accumulibacter contiguus]NMQ07868.1 hypothetical protein [Candidatus Accumulibacter contiguus]
MAVSELAASGSQALVACAHFANALALLSVSFACRNIARSERQATERYRNKLNLLRRTILEIIGSAKLNAMQVEGNANALQIADNAPKELHIADLADRRRWNTALFMKLVYDAGVFAGTVYLGMMLASVATAP